MTLVHYIVSLSTSGETIATLDETNDHSQAMKVCGHMNFWLEKEHSNNRFLDIGGYEIVSVPIEQK